MKNIDNEFREKLKELEVQPSERANQLFMSKIEVAPVAKKTATWKYFALAASVLLVFSLMFGEFFNSKEAVKETADIIVIKPKTSEITPDKTVLDETKIELKEEKVLRSRASVAMNKTFTRSEEVVQSEVIAPLESVEKKIIDDEKQISGIKLKKLSAVFNYQLTANSLTDYSILDVHSGTLEIEPRFVDERSIPVLKEKPLLGKLINEVKYMVQGERLDLDRSGIAPTIAVLAHSEDNFFASESRQFKQGINRLKEVFK